MNDIQKKLLEIAKEYIRVCNLLGLRYYAVGGTCLGAVRHHGFIPWDDDMDFAMPREDYDIFCKKARYHLLDHFFLQTSKIDKWYICPYCKLRDSNTTCIEKDFINLDTNQGIFIDIFPLDGLPNNNKQLYRYRRFSSAYFELIQSFYDSNEVIRRKLKPYLLLMRRSSFFRQLLVFFRNKYLSRYKFSKAIKIWWNWTSVDHFLFLKEWLGDGLLFPFEDMQLVIPFNYDVYLTSHYGDYHTIPNKENRKPPHAVFVDTNTPFIAYKGIKYLNKN